MLCVAVFLAVISMFFVKPDRAYAGYIDTRVLALLFCLMTIMEGFKKTGLFEQMANTLLKKVHTFRQLMLVLVGLCFFCSMWITNDVALLTFVPFTILVLRMAKLDQRMIPVITMETIAANLGSMATPVGNPQNLYLYSVSGMSALSFVKVMGPLSLVSLLLLIGGCLIQKNENMQIEQIRRKTQKNKTAENLILLFLFCVSLATVLRVLPWPVLLGITLLICLILFGSGKEEFLPLKVDYSLLLTFVAFLYLSEIWGGFNGKKTADNNIGRTRTYSWICFQSGHQQCSGGYSAFRIYYGVSGASPGSQHRWTWHTDCFSGESDLL